MLFIYFQGKVNFLHSICSIWLLYSRFYFDLVLSCYFLKWNAISQPSSLCQIFHVIFESITRFSFKFCINLQCHHQCHLYFFSPKIIYFGQKQSIKVQFFLDFWALESKFVKFLMPISNWQVHSSSNFALAFIFMIYNSSVNFKLIYFLLWSKDPIKKPILKLSSALVIISSVPHFIFGSASQFPLKFCITLQFHQT